MSVPSTAAIVVNPKMVGFSQLTLRSAITSTRKMTNFRMKVPRMIP